MHYLTNLLNLWSAQIDWTHQQDVAELKVKTAQGVVLEDQLPSASRLDLTLQMLLTLWVVRLRCWSNRRKLMLSVIECMGGQEYRSSTLVNPEVKSATDLAALAPAHNPANLEGH